MQSTSIPTIQSYGAINMSIFRSVLCKDYLGRRNLGRYVWFSEGYRGMARNHFLLAQPFIAIVGIVGIIFIFICGTAFWWDTDAKAYEVLAVFGPVSCKRVLSSTLFLEVRNHHVREWENG
jgi:hypothetical protein